MMCNVRLSRLANSGASIQHVGCTRNCVNMKAIRASVHQEARLNMQQYCTKQSNYGHVMIMNGTTSKRSESAEPSMRLHREQRQHQIQSQSVSPAFAISTTMLHVCCVLAFYLFITTNGITLVGAANLSDSGVKNDADSNIQTTTEFGE